MLPWPLLKWLRPDRSLPANPSEVFPLPTRVLDGVDTVDDISPKPASAASVCCDNAMSLALSRLSTHSSAKAWSPPELDAVFVSSNVKCWPPYSIYEIHDDQENK